MKYFIQGLIIFTLLLFTSSTYISHDQPKTGYWALKGTIKTHIFKDKTDSLSGPEIFELHDNNGLPIWFGRQIFKDVCMSGVCKMIRLWMFWDGTGNYLGIQTLDKEPLTKSDHTLFKDTDYAKLDIILKDTTSILKDLTQEELIIVPNSINIYEVDGYTAATQPTLAEEVVKDAVYTCHTLWHTVYGTAQKAIYEILETYLSEEFLTKMFESKNPEYISWAIRRVEKHPTYQENFYMNIMEFVKSDNPDLANQALSYFKPNLLADASVQHQLVKVMADANINMRYNILWKFIEFENVEEAVVLKLLEMFAENNLNVGMYSLILRLVSSDLLINNKKITKIINLFLEHESDYVRDLTKRLLQE